MSANDVTRTREDNALGTAGIARLAYSKREAAEALGLSVDSFERHVQPQLKVVYVGRRRLFPVRELERWLSENAARVLEAA
jgi:hypothetical protein